MVVIDICVIVISKGEIFFYIFCKVDKNLNCGMWGFSVFLCYKKFVFVLNVIVYKVGLIFRYLEEDYELFLFLELDVFFFCFFMGVIIECWDFEIKYLFLVFLIFVLIGFLVKKVYGVVI